MCVCVCVGGGGAGVSQGGCTAIKTFCKTFLAVDAAAPGAGGLVAEQSQQT